VKATVRMAFTPAGKRVVMRSGGGRNAATHKDPRLLPDLLDRAGVTARDPDRDEDQEIEAAWDAVADAREDALKSGPVNPVPLGETLARL